MSFYKHKVLTTKYGGKLVRNTKYVINPNLHNPRNPKINKMSSNKKARNDRQILFKYKGLIYENFSCGDYWITLTYSHDVSFDEADKTLMKMINDLRRSLKSKNTSLTFFAKTEQGEAVRSHHHILLKTTPAISLEQMKALISKKWKHGNIQKIKPIYSFDGDNLINYFLSSGDAKGVDKIKYHHTRGIPAPLETNELIAGAIEREPKLPKPTKDRYYRIFLHFTLIYYYVKIIVLNRMSF